MTSCSRPGKLGGCGSCRTLVPQSERRVRHPLGGAVGVVDVVAAQAKPLAGAAAFVCAQTHVGGVVDVAAIDGDVVGVEDPNAVRAAGDLETHKPDVGRVLRIDHILARVDLGDHRVAPGVARMVMGACFVTGRVDLEAVPEGAR